MPDVVVDTSVVQYLHQLGRLDLLAQLYGNVVVPQAVVDELEEGHRRGIDLPDPGQHAWMNVRSPKSRAVLGLVTTLGPGEREVIALGLESEDALVVLDDRLAREHARLNDLRVTGTLGVLLKAKERGLVATVTPLLDELEELGFRLDPRTRAAVQRLGRDAVTGGNGLLQLRRKRATRAWRQVRGSSDHVTLRQATEALDVSYPPPFMSVRPSGSEKSIGVPSCSRHDSSGSVDSTQSLPSWLALPNRPSPPRYWPRLGQV